MVILSNVLVHEVNDGYQHVTNEQLLKFNGQKVLNLKHLMQMVLKNTDTYLRFDFDDDLYVAATPTLYLVLTRAFPAEL